MSSAKSLSRVPGGSSRLMTAGSAGRVQLQGLDGVVEVEGGSGGRRFGERR